MAKSKKEATEENKLEALFAKLNKEYGEGTIMTLNESNRNEYDVISTGSISFDAALGIWGYAKGKLYELRGWNSSGKSTLCGTAAALAQQKGWTVLYIDGENGVDLNYFKALGVDDSKLLIAQPSNGEEGFTIAYEAINTGQVDLVIIDSDSSLIPKKIIDGEIGDATIGKKAKLNSDSYPKIKSALDKNNVCCIVTSQWREKIGVLWGDPKTTQGGHALKFYSDVIIEVSATPKREDDEYLCNKTKIKITKNRLSAPFKPAEFEILFGYGIDKEREVYELAKDNEILKKWGKKITLGEIVYEMEEEEFIKLLRDNEELFLEIKNKVIEKLKL